MDEAAVSIPEGVTDEEIKAKALLILESMESQFGDDAEATCAQLCLDLSTAMARNAQLAAFLTLVSRADYIHPQLREEICVALKNNVQQTG